MISNREIKGQIDELTEHNQMLTQELQEIKEMLQNQDSSQKQAQNKNKSDQQNQSSNSSSDNQSDSGGNQNESNDNQIFNIANDFIKLKGLISSLEKKMQDYTSNSSNSSNNKSLTEEDVINLMLTMMNGMIDWTVDFVSSQNNKTSSPLQ
ncbi:hypothetical protein [Paenibacillus radicis (ex Xue et al. 2023)]|uniref:Uncharacterized protein n=1 Tax=Paenibacillus radicis (ex Xue et al. 2023) TaxID=2972489 RepID=A0ABT1YNX0_9BACL|nr:hypothetical protein [Paenibacillus radicis (ex Xue et al. 2023)]MCR8634882.1 hypothetical protein [Paenibacillus radicis (ex Xue et al. 2023)]